MTRGAWAGNLKGLFAELGVPTSEDMRVYETARIARNSRYRVGRDSRGNPAILIETTSTAGTESLTDFVGKHLRVGHGVGCIISEGGMEVGRGQFSVMVCVDVDDLLRSRFFDAAETLLRSLGETPTAQELRRVIAGLIELFKLVSQPPKGTIQGLWAELWIIARAREPEILLRAWHVEPTDAYDFNNGPERIEVKSTSHRTRRHHFAHRQLHPPTGSQAAIASVFVESSGGGTTIAELVERIRRRVPNVQTRSRLDYVVASTLGTDWRIGAEAAFDSELASESLRYYLVESVPSLPPDLPTGVSDLQYVSDLSAAQALSDEEMLASGELFAATAPASP